VQESHHRSYLTTPIYYVNAAPHIGHAHTSVMADIVKRARSMAGEAVLLSTGTDEHGQKNEDSARESGLSTAEYLDLRSNEYRKAFDALGVSYDIFSRTSLPRHIRVVEQISSLMHENGLLQKKNYTGLYCSGCEQFKRSSDLTEDGRCPDHLNLTLEETTELNYFLDLEPYRQSLLEKIKQEPEWIQPAIYRNHVLSLLGTPLDDLCVSRPTSRVSLGVRLPFDREYVTYVWFDALLSYISNLDWPGEDYETWWPTVEHMIGKDIVKTHCIYWPCMLLALSMPLPRRISVHGHWVGAGGQKMSKSVGNVVDPFEVIDIYGASTLRFYLARHMRGGSDSQISLPLIKTTYVTELGNKLGNLLMRCVKFAETRYGGPPPQSDLHPEERKLLNAILEAAEHSHRHFQNLDTIPSGADSIVAALNLLNEHITAVAPWSLAKDEGNAERVDSVMRAMLTGLRLVFEAIYPVMPEISDEGLTTLGCATVAPAARHQFSVAVEGNGTAFGPLKVLFPRVEA
jgi:methionyl-tRNA synthetase